MRLKLDLIINIFNDRIFLRVVEKSEDPEREPILLLQSDILLPAAPPSSPTRHKVMLKPSDKIGTRSRTWKLVTMVGFEEPLALKFSSSQRRRKRQEQTYTVCRQQTMLNYVVELLALGHPN